MRYSDGMMTEKFCRTFITAELNTQVEYQIE
jgi:hypothetical protein